MESFDRNMEADLEVEGHLPEDPLTEDGELSPEGRVATRDRERELSVEIEQRLRSLYAAIVDFDLAFEHLEALVERLDSGEVRLRSVVDVSGDFEASASETAEAGETHPGG